MREDQIFNDLTDELFGFIAQMGLRRQSSEVSNGEHKATDYQATYDGMVQFARHAHSECLKVRERMLSNVRNDDDKAEDDKFESDWAQAREGVNYFEMAHILSERLRKMDKRAKAANRRADELSSTVRQIAALGNLSLAASKDEVDRVMEFIKWVFFNTIEDNYDGLRSSNKGVCLDEINEKSGEILESAGINLGDIEDRFGKEVERRIAQGRFP